jgi:hypothetical protein
MSNTDSFIEEVTEEVQRDKLYGLLRKYGWIAGVAVLLIVGGAAYNEWRKANERASAQAFGDALLANIDADYDADAVIAAETPAQAAIAGHITAARALSEGETDAGLAALEGVQNNAEVEAIYRELAAFKAALALPMDGDAQARIDALDAITGPFRVLAQEQKAMVLIETGERAAAAALLRDLIQDAEATPGLQRRAAELSVALGADFGDTAPDETPSDG